MDKGKIEQLKKKRSLLQEAVRLKTIIWVTALLISSCGSNNEKSSQSASVRTSEQNQQEITPIQTGKPEKTLVTSKLSLDHFKGIPYEIDGCSCCFSETDQKFKDDEYLFATGFDSIGYVAVHNKLVQLKLTSTEREPNTFRDYDHIDTYRSELYKVIVEIKYKKSTGEEVWWNDGTVTIESKDGQKVIKKIVGECGC